MDNNRSIENKSAGSDGIVIQPFQPEDQSAAQALILAGLVEHWGWLDPSKNPDLDDIASAYSGAVFLVAQQAGRVIGTGALVPRGEDTGEIVRMSVAASHRRQGVGRLILQNLIDHARKNGMKRLVLETTAAWQDVIEFYKSAGFEITHHQSGDAYFELVLEPG